MLMTNMCIRSQLSLSLKIKLQVLESHLTSLLGICSSETHCRIRYLNILSEMETRTVLLFETLASLGKENNPTFLI